MSSKHLSGQLFWFLRSFCLICRPHCPTPASPLFLRSDSDPSWAPDRVARNVYLIQSTRETERGRGSPEEPKGGGVSSAPQPLHPTYIRVEPLGPPILWRVSLETGNDKFSLFPVAYCSPCPGRVLATLGTDLGQFLVQLAPSSKVARQKAAARASYNNDPVTE